MSEKDESAETEQGSPAGAQPSPSSEMGELVVKKTGARARWRTEDIDQPWTIGEAIGVAMRAMTGHFMSIVGPLILAALASLIASGSIPTAVGFVYGFAMLLGKAPQATPFSAAPAPPQIPPIVLTAATIGAITLAVLFAAFSLSLLVEAALAAVRNEAVKPGRV